MKRIVSLVLVVAVLFSICSIVGTVKAAAMSASDFNKKLSDVRVRYPDGCNDDTHTWYVGKTVVGWECHGYARWLSYYVWGVDFANGNGAGWTLRKSTSSSSPINEIEAGNVVRFRRAGKTWNHTIFVTSVDGNTVWYTDCNSDGHDTVKWDQSMSKSALDTALKLSLYGNEAATYGYIAQYKDKVDPDVIHVRDTNYDIDFTLYLIDPSSDHYVFKENHNNTGGYINDVDPVTIHEVYTDGCCKLTYITSAGQYVTAYGKIDWFKTHTHSYVIESEAAHPHKVYEKCYGCGDWYYTGATAENWDSGVVTTSPTCAREGVKVFSCTVANCRTIKTEPIAKLTTHIWNGGTATKEATYFSEGIRTFTCTVCGTTKTEPIPQLEIPSSPAKINTSSANGHKYTLYVAKMTWQQAKEWCEENDGYLASIVDADEQKNIEKLLSGYEGYYWLGGERVSNDSFGWITNEPWSYSNWNDGEPNNYENSEDCVGIYPNYLWNDYSKTSTSPIGFIMETGEIDVDNTYANTGDLRKDIVGVAKTQIGYREGSNNDTKYGMWYGLPNEPWCAMFITWCANQANVPTAVLAKSAVASPKKSYFNIPYYDGADYTPQSGDLFFTKTWSHVGLVDYVDGEYFYTIEGNTNVDDNSETGVGVFAKKRKISEYYFGVPSYSNPITHQIDKNYGTNFIAYLKDPTSDHKVFSDKHGETGGYVNDVDPCKIHEVYTDGCCKFSYTTSLGQSVTAFGKIDWFKHDHVWNGGEITTAATCTSTGIRTYTCTICNEKKTEQIQVLEHDWDTGTVTKKPTATEPGIRVFRCSICNSTKEEEIPVVVLQHKSGDINGDDAVNNKDLTRLMKYLAGEDVVVVEDALDVNGDGTVNNKDLTRLMKYLAGEDVEIK